MTDLMPSLIRTLVPIVVGPLVARFGLDVTDPNNLALVSGVVAYVFYVLVRLVETHWPAAGYLLGIAKQPAYSSQPSPSPGPGEDVTAVVTPDDTGRMDPLYAATVVVVVLVAVILLKMLGVWPE